MVKLSGDRINLIVGFVCLIAIIVSIPYVFISSTLLGVMIREPTIMIVGFTGSFILGGILCIYYIFKSILAKKSVFYSKKGKKTNVKVFIFIVAIVNLIIMLISLGFLGVFWVPWIICVIFNLLAGFFYQSYDNDIE